MHKLLLRDQLFFESLILTKTKRELQQSLLFIFIVILLYIFFYCKFNITRFYICYCLLLSFQIVYYFHMDCFEALFSFAS